MSACTPSLSAAGGHCDIGVDVYIAEIETECTVVDRSRTESVGGNCDISVCGEYATRLRLCSSVSV